jgi:hypothetical protein
MAVKVKKQNADKKPKASSKKAKSEDEVMFPETPVVSDFNGHPMLDFEPSKEKYGLKLGLKKIRAVLEHLDECKAFVASGGESID